VISFMVVSYGAFEAPFSPGTYLPGVGASFYTCPQPALQALNYFCRVHADILFFCPANGNTYAYPLCGVKRK
jgi:hypothetical protein